MRRWIVATALLVVGCGDDCIDERFRTECVAGAQLIGTRNSCTGEVISAVEVACGMFDAGGSDSAMEPGYWDERTSEQVVVSGRFAQVTTTVDGEDLWLADASRRQLGRYDPAAESFEEQLDLDFEPLAFGLDATESRAALGFWDATVLQEISLEDGAVLNEIELTNIEGAPVHAVDVLAAPTYDGVERVGVWFVLTRAELDYDRRRDGLDELLVVVDGVIAHQLTNTDFTHMELHRLHLYEGAAWVSGGGNPSALTRLEVVDGELRRDAITTTSPDATWGSPAHAVADGRVFHEVGRVDEFHDGSTLNESGWCEGVRFPSVHVEVGIAYYLIPFSRTSAYPSERLLMACDYGDFSIVDSVHVGPLAEPGRALCRWSSNGWAMLDEFGRLETFRLD